MDKGYARINRTWKPGDVIELTLPMEVERIEAHPRVAADAGRVAIQRGPIVYCFEGVDNDGPVQQHRPAARSEVRRRRSPRPARRSDGHQGRRPGRTADHGRAVLRLGPSRAGRDGRLGPPGRQVADARTPDDPAWQDKLYRPLDPATLGPSTPIPPAELSTASASHSTNGDLSVLAALNDQLEPKDSCDHTIPRFTWWDHRGTKEWVQYDFDSPQKVSAVEVYWFDDERVQRPLPRAEVVEAALQRRRQVEARRRRREYGTAIDRYNRVTFTPVETTALRIEAELSPPWSARHPRMESRVGRVPLLACPAVQ